MNKRGFSLIELLVVIAIIGILATLVMASLSNSRKKARDTRRLADLLSIQTALETYYELNHKYPGIDTQTTTNALTGVLTPSFMAAVPIDPLNPSIATNGYRYCTDDTVSAGNAQAYTLLATLERTGAFCKLNSGKDDSCLWNSEGPGKSNYPVCDSQ